jgi:hypothetical protein
MLGSTSKHDWKSKQSTILIYFILFSKYSFSLKTSENPKKTTPENAL